MILSYQGARSKLGPAFPRCQRGEHAGIARPARHPAAVRPFEQRNQVLAREAKTVAQLGGCRLAQFPERALEVYRDPEPDPAAPFGWRYRSVIVLGRGASVSPLALPGRRIPIADLLL